MYYHFHLYAFIRNLVNGTAETLGAVGDRHPLLSCEDALDKVFSGRWSEAWALFFYRSSAGCAWHGHQVLHRSMPVVLPYQQPPFPSPLQGRSWELLARAYGSLA